MSWLNPNMLLVDERIRKAAFDVKLSLINDIDSKKLVKQVSRTYAKRSFCNNRNIAALTHVTIIVIPLARGKWETRNKRIQEQYI